MEQPKPQEGSNLDPKTARVVLQEEATARATACAEEVGRVLKKYRCQIVTVQQVVNGQPGQTQIVFQAAD